MIKIFSLEGGGYPTEAAALEALEKKLSEIQHTQGNIIAALPPWNNDPLIGYWEEEEGSWHYQVIIIVRKNDQKNLT